MVGANLSGANLTQADLSETSLIDANLRDANLISANLSATNLIDAEVKNARFGNNLGLSDQMRHNLIERGAIFEETPDTAQSRERVEG